jgi:hypothetical protein
MGREERIRRGDDENQLRLQIVSPPGRMAPIGIDPASTASSAPRRQHADTVTLAG